MNDGAMGTRDRREAIAPISPKSAREMLQPEDVPPPPPRSRAVRHPLVVVLNFFITVLVIGVVVAGGTALFAKMQFDGTGPLDSARTVQVTPGSSVAEIANRLQDMGVISNRWIFRAGVSFYNAQSRLQAGEYEVPAHASMRDVMDLLVQGKSILYAVTIPEGQTTLQIVDRLMADPNLVGEVTEVPPEGALLPETYKFNKGDTRQNIINRMRRERDRVLTDVWNRRVSDLPVSTPEELVTLASIVEKETGIADERTRVAAVFINRLNRDMRLQSDPTVIYGIFRGKERPPTWALTRRALDTPNEYNTYMIDGLPPGPIANPGRASLEAVANPSRTNDLYFVADGSGGHAFAATYEEHQRNVARWRLIVQRRQQQDNASPAAALVEPDRPADPAAAVDNDLADPEGEAAPAN